MVKRKPPSRSASASAAAPPALATPAFWLRAVLILFLASQALFLIGGRTWLPITSNPSTYPRYPFGYRGALPDWTTTVDPAGTWNAGFVFDVLARRAFHAGTLPFWDPDQGLGHPMLENGLTAALYPLGLLRAVVPPSWWDLIWLLHWGLAGWFFHRYLKRIGLRDEAAFAGAAAVLAGGYFHTYLALREAICVAAWFPFLLDAIEHSVREPGWKWRHLALAFGVYSTVTGGQIEVTFLSLFFVLIYGVARLVSEGRAGWAALARLVPGTLAGLLLSAPHWVNFGRYALRAYSHHTGTEASGLEHLGLGSLVSALVPYVFGRTQTYPLGEIPGWSWDRTPGWLGAAAALLAGFAFLVPTHRRQFAFRFACAGTLALVLKVWGVPLVNDLGRLPVLDRLVFPRYTGFALTFLTATLAAYGMAALLEATSAQAKRWALRGALAGVAAIGLMLIPNASRFFAEGSVLQWDPAAFVVLSLAWWIVAALALGRVRAAHPADPTPTTLVAAAAIFLQATAAASYGYSVATYAVLGALSAAVLLLVAEMIAHAKPFRFDATALGGLAVAVAAPALVLGLWRAQMLPREWQPVSGPALRADPLGDPPYVKQLRGLQSGNRYRSYGIEVYPMPCFSSALGICGLSTLDALHPAGTAEFIRRYLDTGVDPLVVAGTYWLHRKENVSAIDEYFRNKRWYDLIGVKFLVSSPGLFPDEQFDRRAVEHPELRPVDLETPNPYFRIWESVTAGARVFFTPHVQVVADWKLALERAGTLADPRREVIVDSGAPATGPDSLGTGSLFQFAFTRNEARIEYQTAGPGVLVLTEACEPGWTVSVEGVAKPLLHVDGAFLGVAIERAGYHHVRFAYRPQSWNATLLAALAGLLIVAGFTAAGWRRSPASV